MARDEIFVAAPPRAVFELLSDPRTYSRWVPGSRAIRAADGHWPERGSAFDHTVGMGPVAVRDHTSVTAVLAPVMLELRARARPLGVARVLFNLQPEGHGTRVTVVEEPTSRLLALLIGPGGHTLLGLRNRVLLRRLKRLGEGQEERPGGSLPSREELRAESAG